MNFRNALRDATRVEHDHLDSMFTALNIADQNGFETFLKVHFACFDAMSKMADQHGYSHQVLRQMTVCLKDDLDRLGVAVLPNTPQRPDILDQLAIDYMVAGSRLGSKVLKKRWLMSQDPTVRRACSYFNLAVDRAFWPSTCQTLADVALDSQRAHVIVKDTRTLFQLFSDVYVAENCRTAILPETIAI